MKGDAKFSKDGTHRYSLWRSWNKEKPKILFIGLNPSRADHVYNDPTIRRCIDFAKAWGYGGLYFGNLFSFKTPYPKTLIDNLPFAINALTDLYLQEMIRDSLKTVVAWGSWKFIDQRCTQVLSMINDPFCLGVNKDGYPKHPLYLKSTTELIKYESEKVIL